jgi:hypothetical protein
LQFKKSNLVIKGILKTYLGVKLIKAEIKMWQSKVIALKKIKYRLDRIKMFALYFLAALQFYAYDKSIDIHLQLRLGLKNIFFCFFYLQITFSKKKNRILIINND